MLHWFEKDRRLLIIIGGRENIFSCQIHSQRDGRR